MYIIQRTDQNGGYLALPGSCHTYTHSIINVQVFKSKERAESNCCENERVISLDKILHIK